MASNETLERRFRNGYTIHAWVDQHEGEDVIKAHWRDPSGKPVCQPFYVALDKAPHVFSLLSAFAAEQRS
jgi:hypothetical protein